MASETILIIDDSLQFATALMQYMLIPLGYQTIHAKNGPAGLKMAQEKSFDLILLDMHMPQMSGLEVLTALRNTDCNAPVIFMTAEGSESVAVEAFRLGVRDYLAKPFTADELETAINGALNELRLHREKEQLKEELIVSETIRNTVITLAHYLNNYLVVLNGNLYLLNDELDTMPNSAGMVETVNDCLNSSRKIEALMRVLQRITSVRQTTYHGRVKMLDIERALREELKNMKQGNQRN